MTHDELQQELASGNLRPAYLLAGEEPLLRDDAVTALRAAVLGDGPADFNHDRVEGESATGVQLLDTARTLPVMAPRRLVEVRHPEAARGRDKGLTDAIADVVAELTSADDPGTVLVVVAATADARSRWVKAFRDPAARVSCDPPRRGRDAVSFARAEAKRQGLTLGSGVAELLVERTGPHLLLLRRELEKAALLAGGTKVSREHVAAGASDLAEEPVWDLTDAIGEGRAGDALSVLARLLRTGAPPPVVLGALANHFRRLMRVAGGEAVAGPPFVRKKLESQARRYSLPRLRSCLDAIHTTDTALKGAGGLRPEIALDRLVLALVG